jgi:hypothetical protein
MGIIKNNCCVFKNTKVIHLYSWVFVYSLVNVLGKTIVFGDGIYFNWYLDCKCTNWFLYLKLSFAMVDYDIQHNGNVLLTLKTLN